MADIVETTGVPDIIKDEVDARILQVIDTMGPTTWGLMGAVGSHIMVQLNDPRPGQTSEDWEHTCDGCDRLLGKREKRYTGEAVVQMDNGATLHITFLMCKLCADQVQHN